MTSNTTQETIPYFEDKDEPMVEGKPIVERNVVHVIVINKKKQEVLCLDWKKFNWRMFIVGGIEGDEDPVQTAIREVAEETGYTDISFIAGVGKTKSVFYAAHKGENRIGNATGLLFELVSEDRKEVAEEEKDKHTAIWIAKDKVTEFLNVDNQFYIWEKALDILGR